jgi:hypothetical protein
MNPHTGSEIAGIDCLRAARTDSGYIRAVSSHKAIAPSCRRIRHCYGMRRLLSGSEQRPAKDPSIPALRRVMT